MPQLVQNTFIAAPPKQLVLPDGFRFMHGQTIAPFTTYYETFGELNADKSNAILVCHALSASAHAAGKYTASDDERAGWWDGLVGYGKGIDLVNAAGQSQTVAISLAPGTYTFICRFHVGSGMQGTLTVSG